MKKKLIRVGYYNELKYGRPSDPSLRAAVRSTAGPDDSKLVAYLRLGKQMAMSPGISRDVLSNAIIGGMAILTDGTYAWPSDLSHYVEKHHVRVPDELLEAARANDFAMPEADVANLEL